MSTFPPIVINHTIIQGDVYVVGNSQTTSNTDCFNIVTAKGTFIGKTPSLEPTLNLACASSPNEADAHSSGNPRDDQTRRAGKTEPRMHTPHPYSNPSSDSLDVQGPGSPRDFPADTTSTMENLRQYIFSRIKRWFDKLFSQLSMRGL